MTRDGNTPVAYRQKQFDTLLLETDECLCSVKDWETFSYALEKKKKLFGFSPDAIEVTIGNILLSIFI